MGIEKVPILGPLIGAAGSLLGGLIGAGSQSSTNKQSIQFQKEMYAQQRKDALSDFTMQNEYNSPSSQMARLREAGLNPNLVYGKGADNTAQAVRSSSMGSPSLKAPFSGQEVSGAIGSYFNVAMQQAQTDNLKKQNTVLEQEAALKAATTANTAQNTARSKFDLQMAESLKNNSLEMATESLRSLKTGTDVKLQENERAAAQNSSNLATAVETILNMRAQRANTEAERRNIMQQLENLKKTGKLQDLDIQLKSMGVQPTDNIFLRAAARLVGNRDKLPELPKKLQLRDTSDNWKKKNPGLKDDYWNK